MYQVLDEYCYRVLNLHEVITMGRFGFVFFKKIFGNNSLGAGLFCSSLQSLLKTIFIEK